MCLTAQTCLECWIKAWERLWSRIKVHTGIKHRFITNTRQKSSSTVYTIYRSPVICHSQLSLASNTVLTGRSSVYLYWLSSSGENSFVYQLCSPFRVNCGAIMEQTRQRIIDHNIAACRLIDWICDRSVVGQIAKTLVVYCDRLLNTYRSLTVFSLYTK